VRDNLWRLRLRVLRYPFSDWQGILVFPITEEIFDAAVDLCVEPATFGRGLGVILSARDHKQTDIPPGFAQGFCVSRETADGMPIGTGACNPQCEFTPAWDDPMVVVAWPITKPLVSCTNQDGGAL